MRVFVKRLCAGFKTRAGTMILVAASVAFPSSTVAVESGASNWGMGMVAFGAGLIPEPGFHFANFTQYMPVTISQNFTFGGNLISNLDIDITANFFLPTFAGKIDAWDARYKVMGVFPFITLNGRYRSKTADNEHGHKFMNRGDPGLEMTIGWHKDDFLGQEGLSLDYAPGLLVVSTWGKYSRGEVLNTGKNRWTIQPNFSYTLFHEPTGIELSQRIMYAVNLRNDKTNYNSGDEFHFDWALGKRFGKGWQAGLFGYFYHQVTGDSGRGAVVGNLKGRAWGVGPIVQYGTEIGEMPVMAALRVQKVLQHRDRTDDDSVMFNFAVSF